VNTRTLGETARSKKRNKGDSMEINLIPVNLEEKRTLSNLYQYYYYDFSQYTNQDIKKDGRYEVNIEGR
jgi:hypothetical protein